MSFAMNMLKFMKIALKIKLIKVAFAFTPPEPMIHDMAIHKSMNMKNIFNVSLSKIQILLIAGVFNKLPISIIEKRMTRSRIFPVRPTRSATNVVSIK